MRGRRLILRRHDLAWIDPGIDPGSIISTHVGATLEWIRLLHPLVVTRQPAIEGDAIALGYTLAPGRKRIALTVPRSGIIHRARPLLLDDAIGHAPEDWHAGMQRVQEICDSAGAVARVYGSLSTQAFTGENCLSRESDLDLLLECNEHTRFEELLQALESVRHPRLDGEILMPSGWAVAWRELLNAKSVLAKSDSEVRLFPAREYLAGKC